MHAAMTDRSFIRWNGKKVLGARYFSQTANKTIATMPKTIMQMIIGEAQPFSCLAARLKGRRKTEKPPQMSRRPITTVH